MTPQTESQFFSDTLYPTLTFKSVLFPPCHHHSVCAAVQRGVQSLSVNYRNSPAELTSRFKYGYQVAFSVSMGGSWPTVENSKMY